MNRIFITGDKHGEMSLMTHLSSKNWKDGPCLSRDDYLIIAGDFGVLWKFIPDKTEKYLMGWLKNKPWTTLFVDGNHENFQRINALPIVDFKGGKAGMVTDYIYHLRRGEVYTIGNRTIFTFGGANSIDKKYRKEGLSWWPEELCNYAETNYALDNLSKVNYKVDCVISHTPPQAIMKMIGINDNICPNAKFLDHVASNVQYGAFFSGHVHEDKRISKFFLVYEKVLDLEECLKS